MIRKKTWLGCVASALWLLSCVAAQPAGCQLDDQCHSGYYCYADFCRECIDCKAYNRNPPPVPSACIKSIVECGSCVKGLIEDVRGDISSKCVEGHAYTDNTSLLKYAWVLVVVGVLAAVVFGVIIYTLRTDKPTLEVQASTRASVQSAYVPSAPELRPPPYEPRPASPGGDDLSAPLYRPAERRYSARPDVSHPFIIRDSKVHVPAYVESDGSQAASPYSPPRYVRPPRYDAAPTTGPHRMPSESADSSDVARQPDHLDDRPDASDHPDDTNNSNNTNNTNNSIISNTSNDSNGNIIRSSDPISVSSPEVVSVGGGATNGGMRPFSTTWRPQDTNNNGYSGGYQYQGDGVGGGGGGSGRGPSVVINVLQNINAVQQLNDVKL